MENLKNGLQEAVECLKSLAKNENNMVKHFKEHEGWNEQVPIVSFRKGIVVGYKRAIGLLEVILDNYTEDNDEN